MRNLFCCIVFACLAAPAGAWLPPDHPSAGTAVDGCSVEVPRLKITALCAYQQPYKVEWDLNGDGTYERVETHRRNEQGWSNYAAPVAFPLSGHVTARWRVTLPCGTAQVFPEAACPESAGANGLATLDCQIQADTEECPLDDGSCPAGARPGVITGIAEYTPTWWHRMDRYFGAGRPCA